MGGDNSPRKKHGTRVSFPIVCAECSKEEILDHVPKGVKFDEILCTTCMDERAGKDSTWATVRALKAEEQRRSWEFRCAECEVVDTLPFKPDPEREYLCQRCFKDAPEPEVGGIADRAQLEKAGKGVLRRRKGSDDGERQRGDDEGGEA